MNRTYSFAQIQTFKGLAILMIVLHNFCHLLPGAAVENEYVFLAERTWRFFSLLSEGNHVGLNLFSYIGHYGVPLFLFVSGYGLVRKYEQTSPMGISIVGFMGKHAVKLWWLLVPGLLVWLPSDLFLHHGEWAHKWTDVVYMLAYISNLFPHPDLLLGPWWYFSLTMQLYFIYRLFLYRRSDVWLYGVTLVCLLLELYALSVENMPMLNYLRYNAVGSVLPFACGILIARRGCVISGKGTWLAWLVLVASWTDGLLWAFSPLFFIWAVIPLLDKQGVWGNVLGSIGQLSAYVFVVHPIVRPYFLQAVKEGCSVYLSLAGYLFLAFLLALVFRWLIAKMKTNLQRFVA